MRGLIIAIGNYLKPSGAPVDGIITETGIYMVTEVGSNYIVVE